MVKKRRAPWGSGPGFAVTAHCVAVVSRESLSGLSPGGEWGRRLHRDWGLPGTDTDKQWAGAGTVDDSSHPRGREGQTGTSRALPHVAQKRF